MDSKKWLRVIVGVVVTLLVFQIGVAVGRHNGRGLPRPHGAIGQIVRTATSSVVVVGRDNVEKTITLVPGTMVTVLGSPDENGRIEARFIRLMPPRR